METEHFFLDLPALAGSLGKWLAGRTDWRPNVLKFSQNLLEDLRPRAITPDLDWGVPVPLDGWRDQPLKRLYVWFDAVIGYLSASVEWARRGGDPDAWREWWINPDARGYYFMGKDNIVFTRRSGQGSCLATTEKVIMAARSGHEASSGCPTSWCR